jgi:hypothetical protein
MRLTSFRLQLGPNDAAALHCEILFHESLLHLIEIWHRAAVVRPRGIRPPMAESHRSCRPAKCELMLPHARLQPIARAQSRAGSAGSDIKDLDNADNSARDAVSHKRGGRRCAAPQQISNRIELNPRSASKGGSRLIGES